MNRKDEVETVYFGRNQIPILPVVIEGQTRERL